MTLFSTLRHRSRRELRLVLLLAAFTTVYYLYRRIVVDHSTQLDQDFLHTFSWDLLFWTAMVVMQVLLRPHLPAAGAQRWAGLAALGLASGGFALLACGLGSSWRMNGWQVSADYLPQMAVYCLAWGLLLTGVFEFSGQRRRAEDALHAEAAQRRAATRWPMCGSCWWLT